MIEFVICVWYFQCMGRTPNTGLGTVMSLYAPEFIHGTFVIFFSFPTSLHMKYLDGLHSIFNKIQRTSKNSLMNSTVTATDLMFPSEDIGIHITIKHNVAPGNVYTKG